MLEEILKRDRSRRRARSSVFRAFHFSLACISFPSFRMLEDLSRRRRLYRAVSPPPRSDQTPSLSARRVSLQIGRVPFVPPSPNALSVSSFPNSFLSSYPRPASHGSSSSGSRMRNLRLSYRSRTLAIFCSGFQRKRAELVFHFGSLFLPCRFSLQPSPSPSSSLTDMSSTTIDQQPTAKRSMKERAQASAKKFTTKEGWLGDFDFKHLVGFLLSFYETWRV